MINDEQPGRLLSDDEFAALMIAESNKSKAAGDPRRQAELLAQIESRLPGARTSRQRQPYLPVFAAAAGIGLALGAWSMLRRGTDFGSDDGRVKGDGKGVLTGLEAFVLSDDGELAPFASGTAALGKTLVFKATPVSNAAVALVSVDRDGVPVVRFEGMDVIGGAATLLSSDGQAFGIAFDAEETARRVCAVAAPTIDEARAAAENLANQPRFAPGTCVEIGGQSP